MRLLYFNDQGQLCLTEKLTRDVPLYAILSHTWGADKDEVSLQDIENGHGTAKEGYAKIRFCGEQARRDKISHFWVDTCCIDQKSSSEVSEAINSMFRWYRDATKCYVYLSDVTTSKRDNDRQMKSWMPCFEKSKWFTRGWTLQELLAPKHVIFFTREWSEIGTKATLRQEIHQITEIAITALDNVPLSTFSEHERLSWAAKRETKKPEDKWYCLLGIFDVHMSVRYGEGDEAYERLKNKIAKQLRRMLNQPEQLPQSSRALNLRPQASADTAQMSELPSGDQRVQLIESLAFDQMDARHSTIKSADLKTCQWLLQHRDYVNWMDHGHDPHDDAFLWMCGKPGAGKSTLMKFALDGSKKKIYENEVIISFFFNARGEELEKSTLGMYQSLLSQLFKAIPDLHINNDLCVLSGQPWTIELLCDLFTAVVRNLGSRRIRCFIDALDECDEEEVQDMVEFFEDLVDCALENGCRLCIFFSSRHYPSISIQFGKKLILEDEAGHKDDLVKYIAKHVRGKDKVLIREIKENLSIKAEGIFMWVVLVIQLLNDELKNGRIYAVKEKLKQIPTKLNDLFKYTLARDNKNLHKFQVCLQWILFAKRPLKPEEFYGAMIASSDNREQYIREWDPKSVSKDDVNNFIRSSSKGLAELTRSKSPTVQFIHESVRDSLIKNGGLADLWPELKDDLRSQCHEKLKQCCRDYLMSRTISDVIGHEAIQSLPFKEDIKKRAAALSSRFPFLKYATDHLLWHANEAAESITQIDFMLNFNMRMWRNAQNLLEVHEIRRYPSETTLLYVLAELGFDRLIEQSPDRRWHHWISHVPGSERPFPLMIALVKGHRDTARALLKQYNKDVSKDLLDSLSFGREYLSVKSQTPVMWALQAGYNQLAEFLYVNTYSRSESSFNVGSMPEHSENNVSSDQAYDDVDDVNVQDHSDIARDVSGRTVLHLAAARGCFPIVERVLQGQINVNIADNAGGTALHYAVAGGHTAIVALLLDRGADFTLEMRDHHMRFDQTMFQVTLVGQYTPLQLAAGQGHAAIVQMLCERGAEVRQKDRTGQTALHPASRCGQLAIVKALIDRGVDIGCKDKNNYTALYWAARDGNIAVVQELVDRGAKVGEADTYEESALYAAAERGTQAIVQILVDRNSSMGISNEVLRQSFLISASRGYNEIMQLLLDRGVDIDERDGSGRTALYHAIQCRKPETASILIDRGAYIDHKFLFTVAQFASPEILSSLMERVNASVNITDDDGMTLLHYAAGGYSTKTVRMLLDAGSDANAVGPNGWRPLHCAARDLADSATVELLLDRGADVAATDHLGWSALHHVARSQQAAHFYYLSNLREIVNILRDKGADTDLLDNEGRTPLELALSSTTVHPPELEHRLTAVIINLFQKDR